MPDRTRHLKRTLRRVAGRQRRRMRRVRRRLRPGPALTILVLDGADVRTTLDALSRQSASARRFEIHRSSQQSPLEALVAAGPTARGTHVVVLAAGDIVERDFVTQLLEQADPGVAVFAVDDDDRARAHASDPLTSAMRTVRGAALPAAVLRSGLPATTYRAGSPATAPATNASGRSLGTDPEPLALAALLVGGDCDVAFADTSYRRGAPKDREPAPGSIDVDAVFDTLTTLAGLPRTHRLPVVDAAMRAATTPLSRVLHERPDRRSELLRRASQLPGFDYGELNSGFGRDLAILYVALPFADTAANIAARRVRHNDVVVDVVTADFARLRAIDASAELLWRELVDDRVQLPGRATAQGEWGATARFCRDGSAWITAQEQLKGDYRSVYSRTMFPGAHLLAARYKIAHPDTPWLAEFSDPQVINPRGERRGSKGEPDDDLLAELATAMRRRGFAPPQDATVWEWAETVTYALADTIMFTNEHQREFMLGYCADARIAARAREHSVVSHHPSPPAELYAASDPVYGLEPGVVHIGYFGAFYLTRSLTEVVAALTELDPHDRARLRLHVFTTTPEALRDEAAAAGVDDVVVANGYVPFLDYLALTTRFDVLLVNDYATAGVLERNPFLPAKYSDYRASGTAVWGIVEPGSVLSGCELAHRSDLGDVGGAVRVLTALARSTPPRP